MYLSIIIATYRRCEILNEVLKELSQQSFANYEIIIIDQTSNIDKEELYQTEYQKLESKIKSDKRIFYYTQECPSVYKARNFGASKAKGQYLLFLDDDIYIENDFLYQYTIAAQEGGDAIIGYHINPGETPNLETKLFRDIYDMAFNFHPRYLSRQENISFACGGNFLIKRDIFFKIEGWDEDIITYGDREMGIRLYTLGYNIVYDPRPKMVHLRLPLGGTRLTDNRAPWSIEDRVFSVFHLAFKHLRGKYLLKYGYYRAARHSFLMKSNWKSVNKLLRSVVGYVKGAKKAYANNCK